MSVNSVLFRKAVSGGVTICRMKTCEEIQYENLLALIEEAGGESALAKRYKSTPAYIKQLARRYKDSKSDTPKGFGPVTARKLEACMEKERGWMDHEHAWENIQTRAIVARLSPLPELDRAKLIGKMEDHIERLVAEHLGNAKSTANGS